MKIERKDLMFVILIVLVVALSVILFFYPSVISKAFGYDYPYTYENLTQKKQQIENNNNQIMANESTIARTARDLEDVEERRESKYEEARNLKAGIRDEDFVMDMPSFLISMEQKAYKEKVTLIIDYGAITTTANGASFPGGPMDMPDDMPDDMRPDDMQEGRPDGPGEQEGRPGGPDDMEDDFGQGGPMNSSEDLDEFEEMMENERVSNREERRNEQEPANEGPPSMQNEDEELLDGPEGEEEEEGLGDIMNISGGEVTIQGLDVTTIPIKIEGTFARVRSYLRYLDEIGMIEPSAIKMSSDGKKVEAGVILNVFHGEVVD